ncbi:hypothetical protein U9M48_022844, partial [Paspalum notatum var. saurae]
LATNQYTSTSPDLVSPPPCASIVHRRLVAAAERFLSLHTASPWLSTVGPATPSKARPQPLPALPPGTVRPSADGLAASPVSSRHHRCLRLIASRCRNPRNDDLPSPARCWHEGRQ